MDVHLLPPWVVEPEETPMVLGGRGEIVAYRVK